jgi:hypothetical protein
MNQEQKESQSSTAVNKIEETSYTVCPFCYAAIMIRDSDYIRCFTCNRILTQEDLETLNNSEEDMPYSGLPIVSGFK